MVRFSVFGDIVVEEIENRAYEEHEGIYIAGTFDCSGDNRNSGIIGTATADAINIKDKGHRGSITTQASANFAEIPLLPAFQVFGGFPGPGF